MTRIEQLHIQQAECAKEDLALTNAAVVVRAEIVSVTAPQEAREKMPLYLIRSIQFADRVIALYNRWIELLKEERDFSPSPSTERLTAISAQILDLRQVLAALGKKKDETTRLLNLDMQSLVEQITQVPR